MGIDLQRRELSTHCYIYFSSAGISGQVIKWILERCHRRAVPRPAGMMRLLLTDIILAGFASSAARPLRSRFPELITTTDERRGMLSKATHVDICVKIIVPNNSRVMPRHRLYHLNPSVCFRDVITVRVRLCQLSLNFGTFPKTSSCHFITEKNNSSSMRVHYFSKRQGCAS